MVISMKYWGIHIRKIKEGKNSVLIRDFAKDMVLSCSFDHELLCTEEQRAL